MTAPIRQACLAITALSLAGLAGCGSDSGPTEDPEPRPAAAKNAPNVVAVVTDDQTLAQLSRRSMPETTRLLADRGTNFTDYFVSTPLCCPSRATFLTGQYAHNTGVTANSYLLLREKGNILPVWLQRAGYRTAHVGKYLNNFGKALEDPAEVPAGWDEWFTQLEPQRYYDYEMSENGEAVAYGDEPADYITTVLNERAVELVDRLGEGKRPFYLQVDHFAPHTSSEPVAGGCGRAAVPLAADRRRFGDEPLPDAPSRNEADISDKPEFMQGLPRLSAKELQTIERHYGCALASLRAVDRGVGEIVDALDREGELDDTAIFFASDNGYNYGEHRIPGGKHFAYEEGIHMPLLARMPARSRFQPQPGEVDEPAANIDLAPTILELAEARPCRDSDKCRLPDGRSLVPLLEGREGAWPRDRALLLELDLPLNNEKPFPRVCSYAGLRSPSEVYIRHLKAAPADGQCESTESAELYDLRADPFQLENSTADPDPRTRREEAVLSRRLDRLRRCAGTQQTAPAGKPPCE